MPYELEFLEPPLREEKKHMQAPRTLRRLAPASKTLIAGIAFACALAGSAANAQQPFNTVMTKLAEGKQVVGGTVSWWRTTWKSAT